MNAEPQDQIDKFMDAARELECGETEQRFKDRLRDLAKAKPKGAEDVDS